MATHAKRALNRHSPSVSTSGVWLSSGRLVSHTIGEKAIKTSISAKSAEQRKDPEALRAKYVKKGFLQANGTVSKRYGG